MLCFGVNDRGRARVVEVIKEPCGHGTTTTSRRFNAIPTSIYDAITETATRPMKSHDIAMSNHDTVDGESKRRLILEIIPIVNKEEMSGDKEVGGAQVGLITHTNDSSFPTIIMPKNEKHCTNRTNKLEVNSNSSIGPTDSF